MALRADELRARGAAGPLTGLPIALKDVIAAAGLPLTADSAVLEGNVASGPTPPFGRACEPRGWSLSAICTAVSSPAACRASTSGGTRSLRGASSSGSGIALAARTGPCLTPGTDTRGSIRTRPPHSWAPAPWKPTFGLVSTAGVIPFSYTQRCDRPMARSAADCAALLQVMA